MFEADDGPFPDHFDRSGTASVKWATAGAEGDPSRIPLGVADMDLPGFPPLFRALRDRLAHPALGYTLPGADSRELVAAWYRVRFGARIEPDWVVLLPVGPRAAVRFVLDALPARGPVLSPTPEYGGFATVVEGAGIAHHRIPLDRTADGYRLPLAAFATAADRHGAAAVLLSSPHNPTGRVWALADIRHLAEIAARAGALVICDEVHSDLVYPGHRHAPAALAAGDLAEATVTIHSIGKTFNVSGLADAFMIVPSAHLRSRITRAVRGAGFFTSGRALGMLAQDIALASGEPWRAALVAYLKENRDLAVRALRGTIPGLVACVPQASYLLWLDGAPLGGSGAPPATMLRSRGLDLQDGAAFGAAGGGFLRLNFALPRPRLRHALSRLAAYARRAANEV